MSQPWNSKKALFLASSVALLALGVVLFLWGRNRGGQPIDEDDPERTVRVDVDAFREGAREAGITFKMNFLEGEQGENFKTNLYDHGCGVVIGDYDNDGFDDIYFLN